MAAPSKQRVKIMTVEPATRRVEGMLKDGSMVQIAVWEVPAFFRWPVPDEIWTITRESGVWMLGTYMEQTDNTHTIEDTGIGEAKVSTDVITLASGIKIINDEGSPEGVVAAPQGSLYLRRDGSTSTTLYVKTSGTGNTGWTAK